MFMLKGHHFLETAMTPGYRRLGLAASLVALVFGCASWAQTGTHPEIKPGVIGSATGTGAFPAVAVSDASMRMNTLYRPARLPEQRLPLVIWGNGGCRDNGLRYTQFLREVASHGFFIIAAGYPRYERPLQPPSAQGAAQATAAAQPALEEGNVPTAQLVAAIDWAEQQTIDPDSPYYGRIDTSRIGVMGTSCGGLQAISVGADRRVQTTIAFNSGVLSEIPKSATTNVGLVVEKTDLKKLHGPIAYINGGPSDIAYVNAVDDLRLIEHVPVFFAENGVGHGGTYLFDNNGGEYAQVAVAWMAWQLNGDMEAAKWFKGADCKLCTAKGWAVRTKNFAVE
jgi:dienelactone hydrolase